MNPGGGNGGSGSGGGGTGLSGGIGISSVGSAAGGSGSEAGRSGSGSGVRCSSSSNRSANSLDPIGLCICHGGGASRRTGAAAGCSGSVAGSVAGSGAGADFVKASVTSSAGDFAVWICRADRCAAICSSNAAARASTWSNSPGARSSSDLGSPIGRFSSGIFPLTHLVRRRAAATATAATINARHAAVTVNTILRARTLPGSGCGGPLIDEEAVTSRRSFAGGSW